MANLKKEILTPDYNKSLLSVSKDVFDSIIQQDGDIDVLSLCRGLSDGTSYERFEQLDRLGWPSWLRDWTRKFIFAGQRMESIILSETGQQCYKAAGQSQPKLKIMDDGLVLAIDGYLFDNVVSTTDWNKSVTEKWEMFSQLPENGTSFESIDARQSAFKKTFFLGQLDNGDINTKALDMALHGPFSWYGTSLQRRMISEFAASEVDNSSEVSSNVAEQFDEGSEGKQGHLVYYFEDDIEQQAISKERFADFFQRFQCSHHEGRFFITSKGYIGRGPGSTREGDIFCIFLGGKVPFVIRELKENKEAVEGSEKDDTMKLFQLLGECCKWIHISLIIHIALSRCRQCSNTYSCCLVQACAIHLSLSCQTNFCVTEILI